MAALAQATSPPPVAQAAEVTSLVEKIDALPTIPIIAQRVGELVNDPRADVQSVARALRTDQSLTAKVLKLANSSYYSIPGGVTDVTRAVSFLGFNTLYQLVLSISVLSVLDGRGAQAVKPRELWRHSAAVAALAESLARRLRYAEPEACFTGGLLHDIGKVALLQVAPHDFERASMCAKDLQISLRDAEQRMGLPDHEDVGTRLAQRWRFPMALRVAIGHSRYLQPGEARASLAPQLAALADITALANAIARRMHIGDSGDVLVPELDPDLLKRLNLTALAIEACRDDFLRAVERSKVLMALFEEP